MSKEHQQRQDVVAVGDGDVAGVRGTPTVYQVTSLSIHQHELDHLAHGQRGLPPDVVGMHGYEVVRVHDGVNEAVENDGQVYVAVISDVDIQPVKLHSTQSK
jgi:lysyl-tRNA synthetase class II